MIGAICATTAAICIATCAASNTRSASDEEGWSGLVGDEPGPALVVLDGCARRRLKLPLPVRRSFSTGEIEAS